MNKTNFIFSVSVMTLGLVGTGCESNKVDPPVVPAPGKELPQIPPPSGKVAPTTKAAMYAIVGELGDSPSWGRNAHRNTYSHMKGLPASFDPESQSS